MRWEAIFLLQGGRESSTSDLSQIVTVLVNTLIVLFLAVAATAAISFYLQRLSKVSLLESFHELLGEKVIVTKTAGPETSGEFRSDSGEEGQCLASEWIYPGMPARITNYRDGIYKIRPLHVDYRDLSQKDK
ncbi:MAG: hypothetical protein ACOX3P_06875 [Saccharofermentanales bacterium]|jgi:hypothetical protein|nr:hypothetical protein [Bacillota bacterium]NLB08507.1 hypothetical protein [Clostridiales bacterium]